MREQRSAEDIDCINVKRERETWILILGLQLMALFILHPPLTHLTPLTLQEFPITVMNAETWKNPRRHFVKICQQSLASNQQQNEHRSKPTGTTDLYTDKLLLRPFTYESLS